MSWSQRYPQLNSAELHHRLSRMIAFGKVAEADYDKARVKVTIGDWTTSWLPWLTTRASNNIDWQALEVGEQVLVLSPSGDMAQALVLGAVYQGEQQQQLMDDIAVDSRANVHRVKYQDGTIIEYDRENHRLKANVQGDVEILVSQDLSATVNRNATVTVGGDMSADITGNCQINAQNITLNASGNLDITAGGTMTLNASTIEAQNN